MAEQLDDEERVDRRRDLLGCLGTGTLAMVGAVVAGAILAAAAISQLDGCDIDFRSGPGKGTDSARLAVDVSPTTGLHEGDLVTVRSTAFRPKVAVGVAVCLSEADTERRGVDACDEVQGARYATDASGHLAATYRVPRQIRVGGRTYDCAARAERCLVVAADADDFDRSGGQAITFAADLADPVGAPPRTRAETDLLPIEATPSGAQPAGTSVQVRATGFQPGEPVLVARCTAAFPTEGPPACDPLDGSTALPAVLFHDMPDAPVADANGTVALDVVLPATIHPLGNPFASSGSTTSATSTTTSTTTARPDGRIDCRARAGACSIVIAAAADTKRSAVLPITVTPA